MFYSKIQSSKYHHGQGLLRMRTSESRHMEPRRLARELECWHTMSLSREQLDKAKQPIEFLSSLHTGYEQISSRTGGGSRGDIPRPGREPSRLSQQTSLADVKKEKGRFQHLNFQRPKVLGI